MGGGGSLAMWRAYFGEDAKIIGLDIRPECKTHEAEGIEVILGCQDEPAVIDHILERYPNIDIVLDDGSHKNAHLIATFALLYSRISPNGVYLAEDLHTSYFDDYGGGLKRDGAFIEFVKDRIDELHAQYTGGAIPVSDFTASTASISIYDSITVFERRPQSERQSRVTGPMPR